jgi:hypothetical protein
MEREEVLSDVGVHGAQWRLLRKRYSIRIEFEQAGSLGMWSMGRFMQVDVVVRRA